MKQTKKNCKESGLTRSRYFKGKLLTEQDLADEQEYHRASLRRLTRTALGFGIVNGLDLTATGGDLLVSPGRAVDNAGNLLELRRPCEIELPPPPPGEWFVFLGYEEEEVDPVPSLPGDAQETIYTRVREIAQVFLESGSAVKAWEEDHWVDVASLAAVPLGHLEHDGRRWEVHRESRIPAKLGS
jgi:hypothetical protein